MEAIKQGEQWDSMEVAKVLLEAGADVNARDASQNTPPALCRFTRSHNGGQTASGSGG
jgi:hypothetical protein